MKSRRLFLLCNFYVLGKLSFPYKHGPPPNHLTERTNFRSCHLLPIASSHGAFRRCLTRLVITVNWGSVSTWRADMQPAAGYQAFAHIREICHRRGSSHEGRPSATTGTSAEWHFLGPPHVAILPVQIETKHNDNVYSRNNKHPVIPTVIGHG